MAWKFGVNDPAAAKMYAREVLEDVERPSFFWMAGPPRLSRWERLKRWVLRLVGRPVVEPGPIATGTAYGFQKTAFNASKYGTVGVDHYRDASDEDVRRAMEANQ